MQPQETPMMSRGVIRSGKICQSNLAPSHIDQPSAVAACIGQLSNRDGFIDLPCSNVGPARYGCGAACNRALSHRKLFGKIRVT